VTIWQWSAAMQRRWLVLLIGFLCMTCVVWAVHKRHVTFEACGSVVVGAPPSPVVPNLYNNNTGGSLVVATGLITDELQSPTVQQQLRAGGATAAYQAQVHNTGTTETPAYSEPEMDVCAYSQDPALALRTDNAALVEFGAILRGREEAALVPPKYFLTENVLAAPGVTAEAGHSSQAYLAIGVIGLAVSITCAVWTDEYLGRRRRRAHLTVAPPAVAPTGLVRSFR
jgi:hypothetical protein